MYSLVYEHKQLCYVSSFVNYEIVLMKVHIHTDHSFRCFKDQLHCVVYADKLRSHQFISGYLISSTVCEINFDIFHCYVREIIPSDVY